MENIETTLRRWCWCAPLLGRQYPDRGCIQPGLHRAGMKISFKEILQKRRLFSEWKPDIQCQSGSIGRDLSTWGNIAVTDTDTYDTVTTIIATTVRMKTAMIDICLWMFWQRENMKCMNEYWMKTIHIDCKNLNSCKHTWQWMIWRKSYEVHTRCIFLLKVCLPQCSCTLANNVFSSLSCQTLILLLGHKSKVGCTNMAGVGSCGAGVPWIGIF